MTQLQQDVLLEVLDRPRGSTTTPLRKDYLSAVADVRYRRGLDGNEWAQFRMSSTALPSWLRPSHVVRIMVNGDVTASGAFEEYRITRVTREGRTVAVEARGLLDDFTSCGLLYKTDGFDRLHTFTDTKTVTQWLTLLRDFMRERGFTYWGVGTVTPTNTVTITVDRWTPRQLLEYLIDGTAEIGLWESRLEYDPAAGLYKLHVVQEYNSTATELRVIGGQNVKSLTDEHRLQDFIAGVQPSGGAGTTEAGRGLQQTLWKVSSVSSSPAKIVLADPGGDATIKCIAFDDQFNAVGYPVVAQCVRTGLRYAVTDSVASTQELYLDTTAQLTANDYVELFYVPVGTTLQRHYYRPNAITNVTGRHHGIMKVGTVTGASLRFQALDPSTGAVGTLIYGRNTGLTGMRLLRSTVVGTYVPTSYSTATKRFTVPSSAGVQVGDWLVQRNTVTNPGYITASTRPRVVTAVPSGTEIETAERYVSALGMSDDTANGAYTNKDLLILRPQADAYIVTKHTGYQNFGTDAQQNIWCDNVTNITAGDYVEAYVDTGGYSISELFSPTALAGYPSVSTDFERRARDVVFSRRGGEPNMMLATQTHFDSNTDDYSGNPFLVAPVASTFPAPQNGANMFQSTAFRVLTGYDDTADSDKYYRATRLLRNVFASAGGAPTGRLVIAMRLTIYSVTAPWTFNFGLYDGGNSILPLVTYTDTAPPPGGSAAGATDIVVAVAVDPTATVGSYNRIGAALAGGIITPGVTCASCSVRIDAFTMYWAPEAGLKADKVFSEKGGGPALWTRANAYLALYCEPPRALECEIADLYRMDRTRYSGQRVLLGAPVSVYNEETSTDLQARVTAVETRFSPKAAAKLTVEFNTQQEALSRRLVEG